MNAADSIMAHAARIRSESRAAFELAERQAQAAREAQERERMAQHPQAVLMRQAHAQAVELVTPMVTGWVEAHKAHAAR
jgi:hypothetical protein